MEADAQQQRHWAAQPERPMLPQGCALYSILIVVVAFGVEWMMQTAMGGIELLLGEEAAGGPQRWMFETGRFLMPLLAIMLGGDWLFNRGLNGRNPLRLLATASLWFVGLTLIVGVLALVL